MGYFDLSREGTIIMDDHLMTWRLPLSRPVAGEAAQACEWNGEWEVQLQCISRGIKDVCPLLVFYPINKLPMKYIYNILELSTKWWILPNTFYDQRVFSSARPHPNKMRWTGQGFHVLKPFINISVVSISLAIQPWAQLGETEFPLASKGLISNGRMPGRSLGLLNGNPIHGWALQGCRGADSGGWTSGLVPLQQQKNTSYCLCRPKWRTLGHNMKNHCWICWLIIAQYIRKRPQSTKKHRELW